MTAAPYPAAALLADALRSGGCVPCHACAGGDRSSCAACLGSGFLRPCHRCRTTGAVADRRTGAPTGCLVCDTRGYTAGMPSSAADEEPFAIGRRTSTLCWSEP